MTEIINEDLPIVDLAAELSKPSETADINFSLSVEEQRKQYNPDDFKTEIPEVQTTETINEEPEEPKKDNYFYQREAKRLVRLLDKGLKMGVPPLYKSLVLEPEDAVKLRKYRTNLAVQKQQGITEMISKDDDIIDVLSRYERLNEMILGISLTDDETDDLVTDLAEVLKLRQKSLFSPEMSLVITVLVIVFARVEPVVSAKFKKMFK